MRTRTYYESLTEYENEAEPGTFAGISITGDEDGPHFVFSSDDEIIPDLPIPACEALAIAYELQRAARRTIRAADRDEEPPESTHAHAERHAGPQLESGMTPYGPREIPTDIPHGRQVRPGDTRALPVTGYSPPASWAGPVPQQRSA